MLAVRPSSTRKGRTEACTKTQGWSAIGSPSGSGIDLEGSHKRSDPASLRRTYLNRCLGYWHFVYSWPRITITNTQPR
eukprot:1184905-Prorocentrum_minimum.AAC.3